MPIYISNGQTPIEAIDSASASLPPGVGFGNGGLGDVTLSANVTEAEGDYNYNSLSIPTGYGIYAKAGRTLRVMSIGNMALTGTACICADGRGSGSGSAGTDGTNGTFSATSADNADDATANASAFTASGAGGGGGRGYNAVAGRAGGNGGDGVGRYGGPASDAGVLLPVRTTIDVQTGGTTQSMTVEVPAATCENDYDCIEVWAEGFITSTGTFSVTLNAQTLHSAIPDSSDHNLRLWIWRTGTTTGRFFLTGTSASSGTDNIIDVGSITNLAWGSAQDLVFGSTSSSTDIREMRVNFVPAPASVATTGSGGTGGSGGVAPSTAPTAAGTITAMDSGLKASVIADLIATRGSLLYGGQAGAGGGGGMGATGSAGTSGGAGGPVGTQTGTSTGDGSNGASTSYSGSWNGGAGGGGGGCGGGVVEVWVGGDLTFSNTGGTPRISADGGDGGDGGNTPSPGFFAGAGGGGGGGGGGAVLVVYKGTGTLVDATHVHADGGAAGAAGTCAVSSAGDAAAGSAGEDGFVGIFDIET